MSFVFLPVLIGALLASIITRKHKEKERFEAFKTSLLPLIEILENRKFPPQSRIKHTQFFDQIFSDQDVAFLNIKARLKRKCRDALNPKWDEYKKKREPYKNRSFTAYLQLELKKSEFRNQDFIEDDNLLNLIKEIFKIAKHN